jgi:hypothetical protein
MTATISSWLCLGIFYQLALCVQREPCFGSLFPRDTKRHRRCFERLKRAYVEACYSEHYKITKEELVWLGEQVGALLSLTEAVCREIIEA